MYHKLQFEEKSSLDGFAVDLCSDYRRWRNPGLDFCLLPVSLWWVTEVNTQILQLGPVSKIKVMGKNLVLWRRPILIGLMASVFVFCLSLTKSSRPYISLVIGLEE